MLDNGCDYVSGSDLLENWDFWIVFSKELLCISILPRFNKGYIHIELGVLLHTHQFTSEINIHPKWFTSLAEL